MEDDLFRATLHAIAGATHADSARELATAALASTQIEFPRVMA